MLRRIEPPKPSGTDANWVTVTSGTIVNTGYGYEGRYTWDEPILRTVAAARERGVSLVTPRPGETYEHGAAFENATWYAAPAAAQ